MAQSKPGSTTSFWQEQVSAWQASGLSQKAYCQKQSLGYSALGYWVRKLRSSANGCQANTPGFVPVALAPAAPAVVGLVLALPNGLEIRGIEAGNLALVTSLLATL